jgi:glycosyltransferase involved in cell wall biosynthesis
LSSSLPSLKRLDDRAIHVTESEVVLISIVRNESLRLPYFFEYYRRLGVRRFFVVDNASTDETIAVLKAQPDCHTFYTDAPFSSGKERWQNALLNSFGTGRWCLIADADELLVYPHCEELRIYDFCRYLNEEGSEAVFSFLLDMYPESLSEANCARARPFTDLCPYFDTDYNFRKRPSFPWIKPAFPRFEPIGGPRMRIFYPRWSRENPWTPWLVRLAAKAGACVASVGLHQFREHLQGPPILYKTPLFKWSNSNWATPHNLSKPVRLSEISSALLHFKFFADFHERVTIEVGRGEHFGNAIDYRRYLKCLQSNPNLSFIYEGSRRYCSSQDLLDLSLIYSNASYNDFVRSATRSSTRPCVI